MEMSVKPECDSDLEAIEYYLITIEFRFGERTETITRIGSSRMRPLACQAEVAQGINCGRYEKEMYGRPCFDVDGFITYPLEIELLNKSTYDFLQSKIECYPLAQKEEELGSDVIEFLANE